PSVYRDYSSVSNDGMYKQAWPLSTREPDARSLYAHQAEAPAQSFVQRGCVANTQSHVPGTPIEAMPRQRYDLNHGYMFRPGDVPQAPPVNQQQGYGYLPNGGR